MPDHYKQTFEIWNKIAPFYQEKFMDLDIYNHTYDAFCQAIEVRNAKMLDAGCGPGNITKYLLTQRPDFNITGTDIAPNMIDLARKNNPGAEFTVLDTRQISNFTAQFDGIICGFCLPYLEENDVRKFISDAFRLLTENGVFYLSFVEGDSSNSGFRESSSGDLVYFHYYTLENIRLKLESTGFKNLRLFRVNYKISCDSTEIHTILMAGKAILD